MLPRDVVESWVREAIDQLPDHIRLGIKNVAFILEDHIQPLSRGDIPIQHGHILLGLYHGVPLPRRGGNYSLVPPDTITLFQPAIEQVCGGDSDRVRQLIMDTVWHEIAHYLGMNEAEVRSWEAKRRQRPRLDRPET